MPKKKIKIVGAGLAGLTAATNLARDGLDVVVLDKEKSHGGRPESRDSRRLGSLTFPSGAGSQRERPMTSGPWPGPSSMTSRLTTLSRQ
ncbi:MAG: NAD(P)-binding protein [Actinobacteria bacterium]|nr:NAD(P)-binding protein [Actinomycetota bacterium]